jgi:polygalacturonase
MAFRQGLSCFNGLVGQANCDISRRVTSLALCVTVSVVARAQDRRAVTEPRQPPVCRSLNARVRLVNGQLVAHDDSPIDTQRIQDAIDACRPGTAVELRAARSFTAFVSAPLQLRHGVALVVSSGAALIASRNPRDYDVAPRTCGRVDHDGRGCRPFIHVTGRDAAIMGDGSIDGRGGATLVGGHESWWDLAQDAKRDGGNQNVPRLIVAERADNFVLYRITLRNSPNFHVLVRNTQGFTAWGVTIDTPRSARNTDGIDPSSSTDVSIVYSRIRCGDDNVAIKAPAGGQAAYITIAHDRFYSGHGMSIGSETAGNVTAVEVRDVTIDGADNGLRIKSNATRGGLVQDIEYENVCLRGVKTPIVLDSFYDRVSTGPLVPRFTRVRFHNVRVEGGGTVVIAGADDMHRIDASFDGVFFDQAPSVHASHARVAVGPGGLNVPITGDDVVLSTVSSASSVAPGNGQDSHVLPALCSGGFVSFENGGFR